MLLIFMFCGSSTVVLPLGFGAPEFTCLMYCTSVEVVKLANISCLLNIGPVQSTTPVLELSLYIMQNGSREIASLKIASHQYTLIVSSAVSLFSFCIIQHGVTFMMRSHTHLCFQPLNGLESTPTTSATLHFALALSLSGTRDISVCCALSV